MVTSTTTIQDNLTVVPLNNEVNTVTSYYMNGAANQLAAREFMTVVTMAADRGVGASSPNADKVTRYAAMSANPGCGAAWVDNTVLRIGSGATAAGLNFSCGFEIDVQNQDVPLGAADGQAGLSPPSCYAFALEGGGEASGNSITAAMLVGSVGGPPPFNRGIIFANNAVLQESIGDYGAAKNSYRDHGAHEVGISLQGTYTLAAIQIGTSSSINNNDNGILEVANASGLRYFNGNDRTVLMRGPVSLAAGSSIFSANNANNSLRPLEIAASELYLSSPTTMRPSSSSNLHQNGDLNFSVISNTQIRLNYKGTDGIVRGITLTLA